MNLDWMTYGQRKEETINSVTTGLVKENWDKEHPGMLKVEYFLGTKGKNVTGWVPVAIPYAFKECGMYALPEIGSEVVIAFNMGDRNCPIVIGCLWNNKNTLPKDTAMQENTIKKFRSKAGNEIILDDTKDKEKIQIHTAKGLELGLDEENSSISISDKDKKNSLLISAKEGTISILADKKIELKAGKNTTICLDGSSNKISIKADSVEIEPMKALSLKSQNVQLEGADTKINGKSKVDLQANGVLQIKGSMVKIN